MKFNIDKDTLNLKNTNKISSPKDIETLKNLLSPEVIELFKKGGKISIKKANRGKFTEYCGGKVTEACIAKGQNSPDPKIRKRATFAKSARKWKKGRKSK
nr:MAG TPA: hypothetical protein [Caudoviricetes sp.]